MSEEEHFQRLVELPAEKREDYMSGLNDPELAGRLRRLLSAHSARYSLLSAAAMETTSASFGSASTSMIGPYKLREQIGEGGMGTVYIAEQEQPVRRKVALKLIKAGISGRDVIARFEAERQSLAIMDHPGIAKVLDVGTADDGQPYFAMELVKGIPITEYCDQNRLTTEDRVRLMVDVCHAVQHAHQKGIIHRDLKPSNILVAQYDDRPVPKVIDFGVAKATHQKLTDKTLYTHFGQIIGTLEYMSPEQAVLNQLDVDTRSDIYSLGVLLYELLVGEPPLKSAQLRKQPLDQILRTIREQEPQRPSLRLSSQGNAATQTAAYRDTDTTTLSRKLRGELDWIVMKAIEKDRSRRYESASQMGRDLKSHLTGNTVDARPPSTLYRIQKAWRRNKLGITSVAAIMLALAIGLAIAIYQRDLAQQANNQTQQALVKAENALSFVRQYCMLLAMTGDPQDERRAVSIAERTSSSATFVSMLKSQAALYRGDPELAAIFLRVGLDKDRNHIPSLSLLGIAEISTGNLSEFLRIMGQIEQCQPITPEERGYAAYGLILNGDMALQMIQPVALSEQSPLFDIFYTDIVSEASETIENAPIVDAIKRLNKIRELVGNNVAISQISLKLQHAALLRRSELDAETLKQQARRDIAVLHANSTGSYALSEARIAMYLEDFGVSRAETVAAWQKLLENKNAGYFQSLPVFTLAMRNDTYAEAAILLEGNQDFTARMRRAICLHHAGQKVIAENLYRQLKDEAPTKLNSHLYYRSFVGDLGQLVNEARELLNSGRELPEMVKCTAELFANPDSDDKEAALRSTWQNFPRTRTFVLGNIARLRLLQAEAATNQTIRQAYQQAADKCIDDILSRPLINDSNYYWAKTLREREEANAESRSTEDAGNSNDG